MNEKLIRKHARKLVDIITEMRRTPFTNTMRMGVLQKQLEAAMKEYLSAGGPDNMEAVINYGKH